MITQYVLALTIVAEIRLQNPFFAVIMLQVPITCSRKWPIEVLFQFMKKSEPYNSVSPNSSLSLSFRIAEEKMSSSSTSFLSLKPLIPLTSRAIHKHNYPSKFANIRPSSPAKIRCSQNPQQLNLSVLRFTLGKWLWVSRFHSVCVCVCVWECFHFSCIVWIFEKKNPILFRYLLWFFEGIPGLDESYLPRYIGYGFGALIALNHFLGADSSSITPSQLVNEFICCFGSHSFLYMGTIY